MPTVKSHTDTSFSFSELKLQAHFGRKLCIDQYICGTILLTCGIFLGSRSFAAPHAGGCSLFWQTFHNTVRAINSLLPFKDFSRRLIADFCARGWRKLCSVTHLGTKEPLFPVQEDSASARNRAIAMMPMTPESSWERALLRHLSNIQYYHSPFTHIFLHWHSSWPWLGLWDSTGKTIESDFFFNDYCYNCSSNICLGTRTVSLL